MRVRVVRKRLRQRKVAVLRQQIRAREGVEVVRFNRVEALRKSVSTAFTSES